MFETKYATRADVLTNSFEFLMFDIDTSSNQTKEIKFYDEKRLASGKQNIFVKIKMHTELIDFVSHPNGKLCTSPPSFTVLSRPRRKYDH